jgi:hypothetical protein
MEGMNRHDPKMAELGFGYKHDPIEPPTDDEVRQLEEQIVSVLPADYREFLPKYGFARWKDRSWQFSKGLESIRITSFSGLQDNRIGDLRGYFGLGLPPPVLVIAEADGCQIVLQTDGARSGSVYAMTLHEIDDECDIDKEGLWLGGSFSEFLDLIHAEP